MNFEKDHSQFWIKDLLFIVAVVSNSRGAGPFTEVSSIQMLLLTIALTLCVTSKNQLHRDYTNS